MSIKYGLISETDARTLERTIDLISNEFDDGIICVAEIGIYGGDTGNGMTEYIRSNGRVPFITGIDNGKDKELVRFRYDKLLIGDSGEVYHKLKPYSHHLIFVDGCHCFAHTVSDFFCYSSKVKIGGYMAFHDTGDHIRPFKDYQHGDKSNPDAYISVRKALREIALFSGIDAKTGDIFSMDGCWKLIFDEADPNNEAGGICVFKKLI